MGPRSRLALVSLAAYLGGGVLAPVAHLAWHRPDHSHGPGRSAFGLEVELVRPSHDHETDRHEAEHHEAEHHETDHEADHEAGEPTRAASASVPHGIPHGHGSLAHFGLALLPAPPPLELPAPALAGAVALAGEERRAALHHPAFPLPRPPPSATTS